MKTVSALTVIELIVVVSVLAVLAAVSILGYNGVQKDARDSTREGVVTTVREALERYYEKNGEYPSVSSLVSNAVPAVSKAAAAAKLGLATGDIAMPNLAASINPLTSTAPPPLNYITYTAQSAVNNAACQTTLGGGCDQFTLQYIKESNNTTVTIQSRRSGRPASP